MKLVFACVLAVALAACAAHSPDHAVVTASPLAEKLLGSEWQLDNLAGTALADRTEMTLVFPEPGRIAGSAACNRFIGTVDINADSIHVGPLATSRRRCKMGIGKREAEYLKALSSAERIVLAGSTLSIYFPTSQQPLHFVRKAR